MLTTFNEADMTAIMALRERRKESFKKEFGVGLGIASFFVKASIAALRAFPALNAEIKATRSSTSTTSTSAWRSAPKAGSWCRCCATRIE
jgi:pyruvate/2-oxoglutarate dehydrogenase complex dihydrolipoamide acyltransferase (E2) component